jgi:ubiquinone/menaquinone biosynthesis C-methylase UbiE
MGGPLTGAHVLETGCGPGFGIDLLYRQFKAARVDAFDLDPKMIALVRQRQRTGGHRTRLWVGNLRHIPVPTRPTTRLSTSGRSTTWFVGARQWPKSHRVLKPGGSFFCEEILSRYITHPLLGRLMDHPQEDRFDTPQFIFALQQKGFRIRAYRQLARSVSLGGGDQVTPRSPWSWIAGSGPQR